MRWKYDVKLFPAKKLVSDWQSEASFLAANSFKSYFHLISKPFSTIFLIGILPKYIKNHNLDNTIISIFCQMAFGGWGIYSNAL